jgi:hypothetical protein
MKKFFWLVIIVMTSYSARAQTAMEIDPWTLTTNFNKPYSADFASDGIGVRGSLLITSTDELPEFMSFISEQEMSLGFGVTGMYDNNTGRFNDDRYSEGLSGYNVGLMSLLSLTNSRLSLSVSYGQMFGTYTVKSGYRRMTENKYLSGLVEYRDYSGRVAGEAWFPAWGVVVSGNLPLETRELPLFGYDEFQHRQRYEGDNLNAIHGLAEVSVVDIGFFDDAFITSLKARGLGGKYSTDYRNIRYWGFGGGVDVVVQNTTALSVDLDYIWGQWQSKAAGIYLGVSFNAAVIPKIWQ